MLVLGSGRLISEGIAAGLSARGDFESAGTAGSAGEVLELIARPGADTDVVIVDAAIERDQVLRLARTFRGDGLAPFLVVMGVPDGGESCARYIEAGANACLTQESSMEELAMALSGLVIRGEVFVPPRSAHRLIERIHALADLLEDAQLDTSSLSALTAREREVLDLLGRQLTNGEISERLRITEGTVKSHVHAVLRKLAVPSREKARKLLVLSHATRSEPDLQDSRSN